MVLREAREKATEAATKTQETSEEYTVRSILQDKKRNPLFAAMLEQNGQKEIAIKILHEQELSANELESLDGPRKEFERRAKSVKAMNESLTKENFQEIALYSPEFKKYVDLVGAEKAKNVLLGEMERMATQENRSDFEAIETAMKNLVEKRKNFAAKDEAIGNMCREYGINTKALTEALGIADANERTEAIVKLVDNSVTTAQRITDSWYNLPSTRRANKATNTNAETTTEKDREDRLYALVNALGEGNESETAVDAAITIMGVNLESAMREDPEVRKALTSALHSKSPEKKPEQTSLQEAQAEIAKKPEDVQVEIEKYKTEHAQNPGENPAAYETRIKTDFGKQYIEGKTKGKGFWATLMSAMLTTALNGLDYKLVPPKPPATPPGPNPRGTKGRFVKRNP